MERLRAGLNGSEWVGWSYVFYPVTPGTSGRCRGGKERPARPPPPSSHESHVLDNALAAARGPRPHPGRAPRCLRCGCLSPKRGWQRSLGPAQPGGAGRWGGGAEAGRGARGWAVTWANLPQGNEVSSRLLGGTGEDGSAKRLTQAWRGISPRSLQPSPLPPPPPAAEGVAGPPAFPRGRGFFPSRLPRPHPAAPRPGIAGRGEGPRGGADVTPWEAGGRPGAGAAEAAGGHAART